MYIQVIEEQKNKKKNLISITGILFGLNQYSKELNINWRDGEKTSFGTHYPVEINSSNLFYIKMHTIK